MPQTIGLPFDSSPAIASGDWLKLCKGLAGRNIKPSPFTTADQPDFRYRLLSSDSAKRIYESAGSFISYFCEHIGLDRLPRDWAGTDAGSMRLTE